MTADSRWGGARAEITPRRIVADVRHWAGRVFSFRGRACRRQFLEALLWTGAVAYGAMLPADLLRSKGASPYGGGDSALLIAATWFGSILILAGVIAWLAAVVRRLHDQNESGWAALMVVVPYIGGLVLLFRMAISGTVGENAYGPDPRYRPRVPDADQP